MIGPQQPVVDITVAGSPAGVLLGKELKRFAYRDVHHGEVDDISFTLAAHQATLAKSLKRRTPTVTNALPTSG